MLSNGRQLIPPTDDEFNGLVYWVGEDLLLTNACRKMKIHPHRLERWMEQGSTDAKEGINSVFANLYYKIRESQSIRISETLKKMTTCPKNWQALAWFLERCFKEDFSNDAEQYRRLLEDYQRIIIEIQRIKDLPKEALKGVLINGQLDSKSD